MLDMPLVMFFSVLCYDLLGAILDRSVDMYNNKQLSPKFKVGHFEKESLSYKDGT
jgi:hypothetical protein